MSTVAELETIRAHSEPRSSPLLTVRLLLAIARFVDTHAWSAFAAVSLLCGWGHLQTLLTRHLDHDELFTFYIAQAPTVRQLLRLTHTVDLHPPLSFLLVRASFAIFGVSSWSCRLPFLLAFLLASALLFWFVRRLLSPLHGLIAVLFLWSTPDAYLAAEARSYALLLCFTTLMLVSWHQAIDGDNSSSRRWWLVALAASGFGVLLSHVLGVFPYAAFFAAELLRLRIRRKRDWTLYAALLVPLTSVFAYLPLIQARFTMLFAREYRITPLRMFTFYWEAVRYVATPLATVALFAFLWPTVRRHAATLPPVNLRAISAPFGFLLVLLSLVPLGVGLLFAYTGTAFGDRYGVVLLIPLAIVPALVLGYRTHRDRRAGIAVALLLAATLYFNTGGKAWLLEKASDLASPRVAVRLLYFVALFPIYPPYEAPPVPTYLAQGLATSPQVTHLDTFEPELPLVAHTGLTFLEIDHQESAQVGHRLYMLTDEEASRTIAHDTVFAHYERVTEVFPMIRGKVEGYCSFVSAHPRFLVVGAYNNPQGWLLRKLNRDGAELRAVGVCSGYSEDCQIYDVRVRDGECK